MCTRLSWLFMISLWKHHSLEQVLGLPISEKDLFSSLSLSLSPTHTHSRSQFSCMFYPFRSKIEHIFLPVNHWNQGIAWGARARSLGNLPDFLLGQNWCEQLKWSSTEARALGEGPRRNNVFIYLLSLCFLKCIWLYLFFWNSLRFLNDFRIKYKIFITG